MSIFPLRPREKTYRGSKESLRRKTAEINSARIKVVEHVNRLVARNPNRIQQYMFSEIANNVGVDVEEVRSAIGDGGSNGITFGVGEEDRQALIEYGLPDLGFDNN